MGYRHQLISDTLAPNANKLPRWFAEKYDGTIDFGGEYWRSYFECKRYGVWSNLLLDVQKALIESDLDEDDAEVRLVFFADESDKDYPDISHVFISRTEIVEKTPSDWI